MSDPKPGTRVMLVGNPKRPDHMLVIHEEFGPIGVKYFNMRATAGGIVAEYIRMRTENVQFSEVAAILYSNDVQIVGANKEVLDKNWAIVSTYFPDLEAKLFPDGRPTTGGVNG